MASDTAPAVPPLPPHAPGASGIPNLPGDPAQPAGAGGGWLAAALAPVEPARHAFDLNPGAVPGDSAGLVDGYTLPVQGDGASSAAYHDGDTHPDGTTTTSSKQETGIVRAWLLAGAERWRKGAEARNKMLDIRKAQAQAFKEARTTTVNRSEKIVGGNTSSGNNASKGSTTKTSAVKKDHATGGKPAGGASGGTGGGRSGAGGHSGSNGHRGNGAGGRGTHGAGGSGTGQQTPGKTGPKNSSGKQNGAGTKNGPAGGSGSASGTGKAGPQGGTGKPGKTTSGGTPSGSTGATKQTGATGKDTKPPAKMFPQDTTAQRPWKKTPDTTSPNTPTTPGGPGGGAGANNGPGKAPAPGSGNKPAAKKNPDTKGGGKTTPKPGTGGPAKKTPPPATAAPTTAPAPGGAAIDTKASREAGYRDGTRIGKVTAHVGAYRDGVKDGKHDMKEAAAKDKARLDKARQQRKQTPPTKPPAPIPPKPTAPPKPTTPPPPPDPRILFMKPKEQPVTTPTQTGPTPVTVDHIDASHLRLGDGADRQHISRGEVRTLKQFERRLEARATAMLKVAERTKGLHAEAVDKATKTARLQEAAKAVKGGEKVAATLARLQETAQIQALKAQELHRRALRAADNTRALLANVKTRYEPLYRAVVDSPETTPAETAFYLGDHSA